MDKNKNMDGIYHPDPKELDKIYSQWMSFEDYVAIEKQKAKEGKADEEITDDEFRQYLLSGKWKK